MHAAVVFGTGCFWGTEKMFWKVPGVYSTAVGYAAEQGLPHFCNLYLCDLVKTTVVYIL
jgi:peptide methionine sulfoxide reductase MsrA